MELCFVFLFRLIVLIGSWQAFSLKLVGLQPLKCRGVLSLPLADGNERKVSAAYLGRRKLEIVEGDDGVDKNEVVLCNVLPIPLFDARGEALVNTAITNALRKNSPRSGFGLDIGGNIINRDKGLFDNLPYSWVKGRNGKLEIFNALNDRRGPSYTGETAKSPHLAFLKCMRETLNADITGLLIEVRDEISTDSVALGAALILARRECASSWKLSGSNSLLPDASSTDDNVAEEDACLVNVHLDELIGFSLAMNMTIYTPETIFEGAAVDARLVKPESSDEEYNINIGFGETDAKAKADEMVIFGPVFRSADKRREWKEQTAQSKQRQAFQVQEAQPAWEIFNPQQFLKMSAVEKRAVLRASGVISLPRPREGLDALDRALLDKMDVAVRGEVLRLLGDDDERFLSLAKQWESPRQVLLMEIGKALEEGEINKAEELREKFAAMTMRRADPTQREGSYDQYLDQDDWYLEARRRAMAPKKK